MKKNGAGAAVKRLYRKILLSRPVDYEIWLQGQRKARERYLSKRPEEEKNCGAKLEQSIRILTLGENGEYTERDPEVAGRYSKAVGKSLWDAGDHEYLLLVEEGAVLEHDAKKVYADAIENHPKADLFYCDSDRLSSDGKHFAQPQCKPDFDPYYLQSTDYIGGGFLLSGRLAKKMGSPEGLYDCLLRAADLAEEVVHVPQILYHQPCDISDMRDGQKTHACCSDTGIAQEMHACCSDTGIAQEMLACCSDTEEALEAHFRRRGVLAQVEKGMQPYTRRITYIYGNEPLVSIIIPNKDHKEDLEKCIDSIRRFGGYSQYEIIIVENNSTSREIMEYYEELEKHGDVKITVYKGEFNYSKINNFALGCARGEYLLFLNNDTEMITEGCIKAMVNYARQQDVGAVGALLLYGDDTIQHAGVVLGYGGIAGHAFEGMPLEQAKKILPVISARSYSAVTAACMMVRRSLFEKLGGFDEALGVAYNDIDLCLRIGEAKKKVIYTPYACLRHYESKTRGLELTDEKAERIRKETEIFQDRWEKILRDGDPHYNPNLTLEKPDFSLKV